MRDLSLNFREAINAQESGEVPIFLLTIDHEFLPMARFSSDPTERVSEDPLVYKTVSRGEDYFFLPMAIVLPDERESSAPRSQIRISHVTRALVETIRSATSPATAKLELVLASALDVVEVESPWMKIIAATSNAMEVTLDLTLNSLVTEMVPCDSFDPAAFPGLHVKL